MLRRTVSQAASRHPVFDGGPVVTEASALAARGHGTVAVLPPPREYTLVHHESVPRESVLPRFTELRSLRRTLGATQACISAIMGVSQSNISKIERRPSEELPLDVLRQYAQALGGRMHVEIELDGEFYRIG